ncbi:zinc ribbon domain-containing protein [Halomicroarcula sp. S1AR25-4]|uniref:zinc ribbon domain-containing protein n=1 Tax=Haloarcula sp. S1AR25-4 TaxID=2950538 RepID=UPI002875B092|nr:zinc ribbon domain-containing protein [Halomicroarcula sp. S1AR25-4]MDS0276197.1 zinc ribbon domain-containing protein [Halomicroarcula sp. S1AR25-4]
MADRVLVAEFRRSISLLRSEVWVLTGALLGALCYGAWVLATGIAVGSATPGLASSVVTTVGDVTVTGLSVLALVLWVVVPAIAVSVLAGRRFRNEHGNLEKRYRLDHPALLLALPGLVMGGCLVATVTAGRSPAVTAIALVASVHLLVRTVAYGYRVYTLSVPRLFTASLAVGGAALAGGWLVTATVLAERSETAGGLVTRSGLSSVVETGLTLAGVGPADALAVLVSVPALLATAYLAVQLVAGTVVRIQAPLSNPTRRPGQRFPIMPPVSRGDAGENGAVAVGSGSDDGEADTVDEVSAEDEPDTTGDASDDDRSHTRVFTPDDPVPENSGTPTEVATVDGMGHDEDDTDDGWEDDTAVFSFDREDSSPDVCEACGETIAADAEVSFCPNCGERLD